MGDLYDKLDLDQLRVAKKVKEQASQLGLNPDLALAAFYQESGLRQSAKSKTGPVGVAQLGKAAAKDTGVNRHNEDQNIIGGLKYLKQQLESNGGDYRAALVDYHNGPGSFKAGRIDDAASKHADAVLGHFTALGGTLPNAAPAASKEVPPVPVIKSTEPETTDVADTGEYLSIEDLGAGAAGLVGGAVLSPHKKKSQTEVANELAEQRAQRQGVRMSNETLARQYQDEMAQYREALELRKQAIDTAKERGAGTSLDLYTNKMVPGGSANVITGDPLVVSQAGVQQKIPQVQQNLQRAAAIDPMAANIDPNRAGLSVPFSVAKAAPPPPVESKFPMPQRPVLQQTPLPPLQPPYRGSNLGRYGVGVMSGLGAAEASNALTRAQAGDVEGATLGAISAAGGAGTHLRNPKAALASGVVSAGAAGAQQLLDYMRSKREPESVLQKAEGGLTSLPKFAGRGESIVRAAVKKGEELIGREPPRLFVPRETQVMRMSEALGPHEGKYLGLTQSDNFGVHGGRMGGNQFPNFQNVNPLHRRERAAWMTDAEGAAKNLVENRKHKGKDVIFSTYIGAPDQLKSNKTVTNDILNEHYKRELTPEQIALINNRIATVKDSKGKLIFPQAFDIRDRFATQELGTDTFGRRGALADIIGAGVGVNKTRGGIALPHYEDLLRSHRDPLTEGVPTSSIGTRLFSVHGDAPEFREDLHPDYRWLVRGEDQGVQFAPVPQRLGAHDWYENINSKAPGKTHGNAWFSYLGNPQFIDEKHLTRLQKEGYADGGAVHLQSGGSPKKQAFTRLATSAYDMLNLTPESVAAWRKANAKPYKQQQDPVLAQATDAYLNKQISQADYLRIMNERRPIRPLTEVPGAHSNVDIVSALDPNKVDKGILGLNLHVPEGTRVGNRLDIPSYERYGIYVDTMHDTAGKPIGYGHTGHLKDVQFKSSPTKAARVGLGTKEQALTPMAEIEGQGKSPFAMMVGNQVNTSDEEVRRMLKEYLKDPEWHQIGMNPYRASQFYDKADMRPVWSAKEKVQAGPLVLARDIEKSDWTDPRLMTDFGVNYAEGGLTGLYANIHAKQERIKHGSGEKMRKPGSPGAPTAKAFEESAKTAKLKEGGLPSLSVGRGEKLSTDQGAGLTAKGRAKYNRETGSNLKAPQPEGGARKDSFCARMQGVVDHAKGDAPRAKASLKRWNC